MTDLLKDNQFQELAKEFKFLNRAKGGTIDNLDCVVFDLETTGLEPTAAEIIEIGAFKVKGKELQSVFSNLVHPEKPISAEITRITGIDNEMVKDAPYAETVLNKFIEFIGSDLLIAHNADFDIPFLKHHLKKYLNVEIENQVACTLKLSRHLLPNLYNHKLHTVGEHFNLPIKNRHRAIGDVEITFQVWVNFVETLKQKGIHNQRNLDSLMSKL